MKFDFRLIFSFDNAFFVLFDGKHVFLLIVSRLFDVITRKMYIFNG